MSASTPNAEAVSPAMASQQAARLRSNLEKTIRGKSDVIRRMVEGLVAGGHILLEDIPGVGKTTLARALARSTSAKFGRIQFTSDLLPSDILGVSIPELQGGAPTGEFIFQAGPIFANIVVADEINRASPKTQSALLEAMSENSVTVDGISHPLPSPFLVIATQNPMEQHGTQPLPESQLDRFMLRLRLGYPDLEHEMSVVRDDPGEQELPKLAKVVSLEEIQGMQITRDKIKFTDSLTGYLLSIVEETRTHEAVLLGVSTRGALSLRKLAQARALLEGRDYCIPDDVRDLAIDAFAHRMLLGAPSGTRRQSEEAEWVLREILERVPVPL